MASTRFMASFTGDQPQPHDAGRARSRARRCDMAELDTRRARLAAILPERASYGSPEHPTSDVLAPDVLEALQGQALHPEDRAQLGAIANALGIPPGLLSTRDPVTFERFLALYRAGFDHHRATAFDQLAWLADPELNLRALVIDDHGRVEPDRDAGRDDGRDDGAGLGTLPAGANIELRLKLPRALRGGQVLLFEQDASGLVSLLSRHALMAGDLRFDGEVMVPRHVRRLDHRGPVSSLRLTEPGQSELLAVIVSSRWLRLDRAAAFIASHPDSSETVRPEDLMTNTLRDLLNGLATLDNGHWAVARRTVNIVRSA